MYLIRKKQAKTAAIIFLVFAALIVPSYSQEDEPSIIIKFNVFTSKTLDAEITPSSASALPGKPVTYRVDFENRNPVPMDLDITTDIPAGWSIEAPTSTRVMANGEGSISLTVTSNESAVENVYRIIVRFENIDLSVGGSVVAQHIIGLRGAPDVGASPEVKEGVPGSSVTYEISVTNTDPADFDASSISLNAVVPSGWEARFSERTIRISPGETGISILTVTSSESADKDEIITINATANRLSSIVTVEYKMTTCGDGICQLNEACPVDCPPETFIFCAGRCESEADDGVFFSATFSQPVDKFIVCSHDSTEEQCLNSFDSRDCGFKKACMCSDGNSCLSRCVDEKGAYYMLAKRFDRATRSNANYSFTCPFVNLPEIISLRDSFNEALDFYERSRSSFQEIANTGENLDEVLPCISALDVIISKVIPHANFLAAVVESPAKSNTTQARALTSELRNEIDTLYNRFCTGATGALRIVTFIEPQKTETGDTASTLINIKNNGTALLFSTAECGYFPPSGETTTIRSSCEEMQPGATKSFNLATHINQTGDWFVRCQVLGSVQEDCSFSTLHDTTEKKPFEVFTKDVFVTDVSGSVENGSIICEVRSSNPVCSGCRSDMQLCSRLGEEGETARFLCPPPSSLSTELTGYVFASGECNPIEPKEKTITLLLSGCGNNVLDEGEECEPPGSENNINVVQTTETCVGPRFGTRDGFGLCTDSCVASEDEFSFAIVAGQCGAECSDGETRNKTVTTEEGSCVCTQQCGPDGRFLDCFCEPTRNGPTENVTTTRSGSLSLTVGHTPHAPEAGDTVDIKAIAETNGTLQNVKIYLNGILKKQCDTTVCVLSDEYDAGTYTYFATAQDDQNLVSNPVTGTKTFKVRAVSGEPPRPITGPRCSITIQSKSCSFDEETNRYDVEINAVWEGGEHAHGMIDGDESRRITIPRFDFTRTLAGPGLKAVRAEVHDSEDNVLCSDKDEVFCAGETTTGELSIVRDLDDVVQVGTSDVAVSVISPAAVSVKLVEKVDSRITVRGLSVSGNTSSASITGPAPDFEDVQMNSYTIEAEVEANKPLIFSYMADIFDEGDYKFIADATALGETERNEKTVRATSCTQTFSVKAISPDGICIDFVTACDVPEDWTIVERCPEETEPTEESPLLLIIVIIIIAVIAIVGIKYKDRIREKLVRIKKRSRQDKNDFV